MKKLILFISFALLSVVMYGQAGNQTFAISAGAMFPLGDLGNNNLADSSSGAAANGIHIQVSYDYQISHYFGLGVDVEVCSAKYSMKKVSKYYEDMESDTQREYFSTNGWTLGGIYVRYYLHLPLGKKVSWDIAPLVGAMATYSPKYTITSTSIIPPGPNPSHTYYRQRSKAFSFAYGMETKINFRASHHGFFIEGRILNSKTNFKHVVGTGYNGKLYDKGIKMNLMYITASLGYTYYL